MLRLAEVPEAFEAGDVYEGEPGQRFLPTLLHWTVRIVLLGGLVAGGALAALNWRTWFPRAAELGQTVFTETDRQARSGQRTEEQQRALREAAEAVASLRADVVSRRQRLQGLERESERVAEAERETAARVSRKVAVRLTAITFSQSSSRN